MPRCAGLLLVVALGACSAHGSPEPGGGTAGGHTQDGGTLRDDPAGSRSDSVAPGRAGAGGSGGSHAMSTQGDAPAGYCPGVPVGEQDRPCWDGGKQTCFPCLSPLMTHGACSGVGASPAPPPLPVCVDDAGCARRNTRCDPGHPYRNEQGCRPLGCDEGAQCPTGMVCDPSSPLANPPFLRLVPGGAPAAGCRLLSCDDPGAPSCQTNAVRCSDPGGTPCAAGSVCDARQPGLGCRPLACNEAGATPCSDGAFCAAVAPGSFACVECLTNEDCGCGSCIGRVCYNRPGYCEPGCA